MLTCVGTGGPNTYWTSACEALDRTRKHLIKQAKGEREVHWAEVIKKARVPNVHASVAGRSLQAAGISVAARTPREKPMRTPEMEQARVEVYT